MSIQSALEALKRRDFNEALAVLRREDAATFGLQHFLIKGLSEMELKDWAAALETFVKATGRFPAYGLFWLNRGIAEENVTKIDEAIESQARCLSLLPDQAQACGNLSNLYRRTGRFVDSERMARRALELGASKAEALNCLGLAFGKQYKFDEARGAFLEAHRIAPENTSVLSNLGNLEAETFHFDAAWKWFGAARKIDDRPVFRHDEGLARMLSGDIKRGLELFEARLEMPGALRLRPAFPRWNGESLKGKKLLIIAEQGLGDAIQFCRYAKFLPEGEIVWAVPKALVRLLKGAVRGEVLDEKGPVPVCDYYLPIISLALATKAWDAPFAEPYLAAREGPAFPTGKHKTKIGLVWAGSKTHLRDNERSIPLALFEPLLKSVEADFYAPFLGDALDTIGGLPVQRLDDLISDFADTAALLKQMDALISVDTAVAHLAGALGVKTYVLLPKCPDWRWGVQGETTPLYGSMTLVRQDDYGDWRGPLERLSRARLA